MLEGKRLNDRYKIIEMIGGGGMSNVYLAHDMILNRDVAVKVLRYDFSNEDELQRRFQREALSATSLTHPNIVSVYDVGDEGDLHYIVMEYVRGKTLKQYIQEYAPISPSRTVHIMKQLTSAIAHAHDNQIIHRDIKPQNVLMDDEGNVKITDFGIAMTLASTALTQTNSVMGTVHYLSPEQARGGMATNKSDIYSLGIVMYELLTGELPFSGESAVSIALMHLQTETPSIREFDATIPQSLENMVLKATAKDPFKRYSSVEEMQEDLETVLSLERVNEPKFSTGYDDDATKAMPIIKDDALNEPEEDLDKTMVLEKVTPKKPEAIEPPSKSKKWPLIIGGFVSLMIITLLIIALTDPFKPTKTEVPDVTGMTLDEATTVIEDKGFLTRNTTERFDDAIEEGKVVETSPKAGTLRMKNAEIDLIISKGIEQIEMKDYMDKKYDQVERMLSKDHYKEIKKVEEYSEQPAGTIINQDPAPGEKIIVKDTVITFTVSKGKDMATVKDLSGYSKSALKEFESSSSLHVSVRGEEYSDHVAAGMVISQSPKAGTSVEVGSTVEVTLSKGPKEKPSKLYVQNIRIPYTGATVEPPPVEDNEDDDEDKEKEKEPVKQAKEQKVRIYIQDKNHTMAEPVKEMMIKEDTNYQIKLEIMQGQKAAYRIMRDDVMIAEDTISYDSI